MSRVLLFSGGGDYADPWHPFASTSAIVADVLRHDDHEVEIVDTLDGLDGTLAAAELLVVNAGGGPEPHPLDERLNGILEGYSGPLLALHVAATLLPGHDLWERTLGGRWVRGVSMHPPRGDLSLRAATPHEVVDDLAPFHTVDEGYAFLRVDDDARVLLEHEHDGRAHPVCWLLERDGRRTAYDALGHDVDAYRSQSARRLIQRLARWLHP